jgi:diguanylate cyclase
MSLDPQTLLTLNVANLLALAILLPIIMGRRLSVAARAARRSLIVHAAAWMAVIFSELWPTNWWLNISLSTLSMICFSACNWLLFQALSAWLGPRRFGRALLVLAVAMPIGYVVMFQSYEARVGWSNLLIALQVGILAHATLKPATRLLGPWRFTLFACLASMSVLTLARGVLGAFFSDLYPSFAAPHPINLLSMLVANVTMVLGNMSILVAWREEAELQLHDQAVIDPLTGVLNRRGWNEHAIGVFSNSVRHQQPLALISLDLDHFKRINDERGHEAGDAALRLFGSLLRSHQRAGDVIARIGGEEFCVLLPMADRAAAQAFDLRLRTMLHSSSAEVLGYVLDYSAGLACRHAADADLGGLQQRSDAALYQAKHDGRGRLVENAAPAALGVAA